MFCDASGSATYAGGALANDASRCTWYGHSLLVPSTAGEYNTYTRYKLFYESDEKVSLTDIFELTRSRFEGTQWQPEEYNLLDQRVIGIERQMTCHAIEIYPKLPAAMACVNWTCMANAEHSVYLPQSSFITDVEAYLTDNVLVEAEKLYRTYPGAPAKYTPTTPLPFRGVPLTRPTRCMMS